MIIEQTSIFSKWFNKLKDFVLYEIITDHINRLKTENFSCCKSVGGGIHEIKIYYQKGYRIYFTNKNGKIIILLCAGDKSTQKKDIEKAKEIKEYLKNRGLL